MSTRSQDAKHQPLSRVDRLRQDAQHAAQVRRLTTHPDVVALRVERYRTTIDALAWIGIVLGLGFTMVNVQQFAAAGAPVWSLTWCAAWLLDPMVSLVLIAVLLAEQITARYQVPMRVGYAGPWVQVTKRFAFAATYAMNTWASFAAGSLSGVVLHSVPPLMVFCAAEAAPILRDRLTEAVLRAEQDAAHTAAVNAAANTAPGVHDSAGQEFVNDTAPVHDPGGEHQPRTARPRSRPVRNTAGNAPRKPAAAYLAEARAAWTPGTVVSPAWVREVTDCSRGTSKKVADALTDEITHGHHEGVAA
ncbi:MAG: hypothetical protein ACJ72N_23980 [Labedaea sp.]